MSSEDKDAPRHLNRDARFLPYSGPHLDQRQQPASSYGNRRSHLDGAARHQQVYANNSRYIEARIKNRMEMMRLDERRHTLERQQREATMIIDRNKRKFAEEMANVARTTSHLTKTAPRYGYRRRRPATADATVSRRKPTRSPHEKHDIDSSITQALVALQLYERNVQLNRQREFRPSPTTGRVYSAGIGLRSRPFMTTTSQRHRHPPAADHFQFSATHSSKTAVRRAWQSAAGSGRQSAVARQDSVKRMPTFTGVYRVDSALPDRPSQIVQATSVTDFAAVATKSPDSTETDRSSEDADGVTADRGRESSSRWRRDLKREAPPALHGQRPSLNFPVVLSLAERRRRLFALQTRQVAPLATDHLFTSNVKR